MINKDENVNDEVMGQSSAWYPPTYYQDMEEETVEEELEVIKLYNHDLTLEENFSDGGRKFICIEVLKSGTMVIMDNNLYESPLSGADKFVLNREQYEAYDTYMVDYDTIFGTRFLAFRKYNSDYFSCEERVFFEALLIKYRKSDFKKFYWSKTTIKDELGIKPDKAEAIIKRFKHLGFLNTEIIKSYDQIKKRPQQVTYFSLNCEKLLELLPSIYKEDAEFTFSVHRDVIKYLAPAIKNKKKKSTSQAYNGAIKNLWATTEPSEISQSRKMQ